jgi:hypothetical protein
VIFPIESSEQLEKKYQKLLYNMKENKKSDENPFSFKKFLNKTTNDPANNNTASSISPTTDSFDDLRADIKNNNKSNKKPSETSNPFSFKQFLNDKQPQLLDDLSQRKHASSIKYMVNDLVEDLNQVPKRQEVSLPPKPPPPLPPPLSQSENASVQKSILPDFLNQLIPENNELNGKILLNDNNETDNPYPILDDIPCIDEYTETHRSYFDLEPTVLSNELSTDEVITNYYDLENGLSKHSGTLVSDLDSNSALDKIEAYKKLIHDKQRIIDDQFNELMLLRKQLDKIKHKEDLENKTLEKMILNVEKNLQLTTERAIEAEKSVDRLKVENKNYKIQMQNLEAENLLLKNLSHIHASSACDSNTLQKFSVQLNTIANTAEQSFKQLFTGIDNIRLLASAIESFDKIKDLTNQANISK